MYQKITYYSRISQTLYVPAPSGFTPTSPESSAFLARATNVTLDADKTAYDTMITGLVNDGVWAKLDCLYIFAAVDRTTALLNLISASFACLENGTVNFTAYAGYQGNGAGAADFYLDTQFTPSSDGVAFQVSSQSLGVYILSDIQGAGTASGGAIGTNVLSNTFIIPWAFGPGNASLSNTSISPFTGGISSNGFTIVSNVAGTMTAYNYGTINGINGANGTAGDTAGGLTNVPLYIFALSTPAGSFSRDQMSCAFIGGGLTGGDVTNMKTKINAYMNTYSHAQY